MACSWRVEGGVVVGGGGFAFGCALCACEDEIADGALFVVSTLLLLDMLILSMTLDVVLVLLDGLVAFFDSL